MKQAFPSMMILWYPNCCKAHQQNQQKEKEIPKEESWGNMGKKHEHHKFGSYFLKQYTQLSVFICQEYK